MKKLLALLLALMLPCCALADTVGMDWSLTVDSEGLIELFYTAMNESLELEQGRYPLVETWFQSLAAFSSDFTYHAVGDYETGRGHAFVAYQDEELFSYDRILTEEGTLMLHSLLPETPILFSNSQLPSDVLPRAAEAWQSIDWASKADLLTFIIEQWSYALDQTEEIGHFAGDAYTGGTHRTTIRFDERDLALLLDMILDTFWSGRPDDLNALISYPFLLDGQDPDAVRSFLHTSILRTAQSNRYHYVLHVVRDDQAALIGLSLVVYLEERQVATLSIGGPNGAQDGIATTIILGYGLNGENYYVLAQELEGTEDGSFFTCTLLRDPAKSFQASASNPDNELMRMTFYNRSEGETHSMEVKLWSKDLEGSEFGMLFTSVHAGESGSFEGLLSLNQKALFTTRIDYAPTEALPPLDLEGLQPLALDWNNITEDQIMLIADDANASISELFVKLFKLMPPELMMLPINNNFLQPK